MKFVVRHEIRMDPNVIPDGYAYSTYVGNAAGSEATEDLEEAYEFEVGHPFLKLKGKTTEQGPVTFTSYVVTKEEARKLDEVMTTMNRLKLWT